MPGDSPDWVFGELGEYVEGRHKNENDNTYRHVGEIGDNGIRTSLTKAKASFDRLIEKGELPDEVPGDYYETRLARQIRQIEGTETASRAVASGDAGTLRSMTGAPDKATDLSYQEPIRALIRILDDRPTPMMYLAGSPGTGKTYLAKWIIELWKDNVAPDGIVASNLRTLTPPAHQEEDGHGHADTFDSLKEWVEQDANDDHHTDDGVTPKAILIDEASSALTGSGAQGYNVREFLAPLVFKIRQHVTNDGLVIWIGHDKGDVHPIFRALAMYVEKVSEKDFTIYESVRNRSGVDQIQDFTGTPPGNWQVGEFEKPSFDVEPGAGEGDESDDGVFDVTTENQRERDMDIINAVSTKRLTGKSNATIAEEHVEEDRSPEWVRQKVKAYEKGELDEKLSAFGQSLKWKFGL
jgi:hypothetical protein